MRKPDLDIGPGYLQRWYIIPRNKWFNIYLHKILRDDADLQLHDHPWWSLSFLLKGELLEESFEGKRHIPAYLPIIRSAKFAHRLEVVQGPVWTIFITGPKVRKWGFYTHQGWVGWADFLLGRGKPK